MKITRRKALKVAGGAVLGGLAARYAPFVGYARRSTALAQDRPLLPRPARRAVIVGAGISGAMCARTLRRLAPDVETVLIERNPTYVSGPSHVDYVVGIEDLARVTVGFDGLARDGVRIVRAAVTGVRPRDNRVETPTGFIEYNALAIATGTVPADHEIAGLTGDIRANPHAWTWAGTVELRKAVEGFRGGTFVISVPPPPYKCPPGPYEIACLVEEFWRKKGVRAEIAVLDASDRPQPPALADLWRSAMADRRITYRPLFKVVEVDLRGRVAISDKGERQTFAMASIIPPQKAPLFVEESGLDFPFIDVDPATFRSRRHENIFAFGDVGRLPYTKSAFTAFLQGRNAAYYIARALGVDRGEAEPVYNQCWPFVSSTEALLVEAAWTRDGRAIPERTKVLGPRPDHAKDRKRWEYGILRAAYG